MKDQLPAPQFDATQYERPNQKWICGKAAEGRCCRVGPDDHGNCRAAHECRPLLELKPGEAKGRYRCTRTPEFGDPCESGPRPDGSCCRPITKCQPVRSLRSKRKVFTQAVMIVTVAILLLALGDSHWRAGFLNPGELSGQHSSLTFARMHRGDHAAEQGVGEDCGACHAAAMNGPSHWVNAAAFHSDPAPAEFGKLLTPAQAGFTVIDESCQRCHEGHKFHQPNVVEDHSCSACHQEHMGKRMLRPEDSNCASCHANPAMMAASLKKGQTLKPEVFDYRPDLGRVLFKAPRPEKGYTEIITKFDQDHPEFQVIRNKLRDPDTLKFNHQKHLTSPTITPLLLNGKPLDCDTCHKPDATGLYYQPISYAKNCQGCHSLDFDERNKGLILPHGNPEFARAFLRSLSDKYEDYARTDRKLTTQKEIEEFARSQMLRWGTKVTSINELEKQIFLSDLYSGESQRPNGAEQVRARFPGCATCHEVKPGANDDLPMVTRPVLVNRWLIRGRFDHSKHTVAGADPANANLVCATCHKVTQSHETSDILIPSQAVCVKCHSPKGGVASTCSTCHSYHAPAGTVSFTTAKK